MIRKLFVFICCALSAITIQAQINMTLQVPPAGILLKNQLWNMLLVSSSNGSQLIKINVSLLDAQNNQVLLTAASRTITITKGATQLQVNDFTPIQYNYYSSIFNNDRDPNGMLPAGNYIACYTIMGDHNIRFDEDCISINVEPLSPPLLNTPANESVLQTNYPQFTWLPPTPKNIFGDLNYDFLLVEVLPGQASREAIQNNVPVYSAGRVRDLFYNYPASNKQLDTSKLYAWQVIAKNSYNSIISSDVWTFKITNQKPGHVIPINGSYILIQKSGEQTGVYTIENTNIGIKYYSFDPEHEAEVRVLSANGKVIKIFKEKISYGDNFFNYKLTRSFKKQEIYFIEIRDKQNNKYSASFRIK